VAKSPPKTAKSLVALGGSDVPGVLSFALSDNFPAGKYVMRGLIKDELAGKEVRTERTIEVAPLELGIVRLQLANDADGRSPSGGNVSVGQSLHIQCRAVGFTRKEKRIHLIGSMRVLDGAGKDAYPNPLALSLDQEVPDEATHANFNFVASGNRTGRFTVQIEVHDRLAGKTVTRQLPIVVHASPELSDKGK
jgi:hypothetical protein